MDSEPAAGTDHGDGFAGLDAPAAQHLVWRSQRIGDDSDFGWVPFVIQGFRQLYENMSGQLDVFGVAAIAVEPNVASTAGAQWLEIGEAPSAVAAIKIVICGYAVADGEPGHAEPDLDDLAGDLMADNARKWDAPSSGLGVLNGQTRTAGKDTGDGLARAGNRVRPINKLEWDIRSS